MAVSVSDVALDEVYPIAIIVGGVLGRQFGCGNFTAAVNVGAGGALGVTVGDTVGVGVGVGVSLGVTLGVGLDEVLGAAVARFDGADTGVGVL